MSSGVAGSALWVNRITGFPVEVKLTCGTQKRCRQSALGIQRNESSPLKDDETFLTEDQAEC